MDVCSQLLAVYRVGPHRAQRHHRVIRQLGWRHDGRGSAGFGQSFGRPQLALRGRKSTCTRLLKVLSVALAKLPFKKASYRAVRARPYVLASSKMEWV